MDNSQHGDGAIPSRVAVISPSSDSNPAASGRARQDEIETEEPIYRDAAQY
ncbi:MAG: hypothetical protein LBS51_06650 [Oscillospiraceae bacterium]|nr:hypothetical protein [Oscillospiraceae bacterium]